MASSYENNDTPFLLLALLLLVCPFQTPADNLGDSNRLFDWAEVNFPGYFSPPGTDTAAFDHYLYRHYPDTDMYLGTSGEDVFVHADEFGGLLHVGQIGDYVSIDPDARYDDMLTPGYYQSAWGDPAFRSEVDKFIHYAQAEPLHHPLASASHDTPRWTVPSGGTFGAGKGPGGTAEHHTAVDLYVGNHATDVAIHAAHSGVVATYRDAEKYRHYLSIAGDVVDHNGAIVGTLVTLYAHIDLDADERDGLFMEGRRVETGDLVSRHLYSGTAGGPHLHFEIRYYRPGDDTSATFYGWTSDPDHPERSTGPWSYGYWNGDTGYGFGDPRNHGLILY